MSYVAVNTQYLRNLASTMRRVEASLRDFSQVPGSALHSSPIVCGAYGEMSRRWDQRRGELAEALASVADGFDTTVASFEETDAELASELGGGEA